MLLSTSTSGNQQQEGHTHSIQHGKRLGGCLTGAGRCWSATHLSNASREVPCKNHAQTQAHSQVSCRGNCLHQRALNLRGHCLDNRMLELQRSCHKHWPPLSPTSRGGNELPFEKYERAETGHKFTWLGPGGHSAKSGASPPDTHPRDMWRCLQRPTCRPSVRSTESTACFASWP